jgi:hypothetical protein
MAFVHLDKRFFSGGNLASKKASARLKSHADAVSII